MRITKAGVVCCEMTENNGLYIRLVGTLNRHRRKGVGKAMLGRVMQEANKRDIQNVYTFIRVDNKVNLEIYHLSSSHFSSSPRLDFTLPESSV